MKSKLIKCGLMLTIALSLPQAAFADAVNYRVESTTLKEDDGKNYKIKVNYKEGTTETGEVERPELDFVVSPIPADGRVSLSWEKTFATGTTTLNGSKLTGYLLAAGKTTSKTLTTTVTATAFLFKSESNGYVELDRGKTGWWTSFGTAESIAGKTGTIDAGFYKGETLHTATYDMSLYEGSTNQVKIIS